MILIDFSQILFSSVYADMKSMGTKEPSEHGIRIYVLDKLISIRTRFERDYGSNIVIAIDGKSWRKTISPYYKFKRGKTRDEDSLDWTTIYGYFGNVKEELKNYFPYKVIEVEKAEGDDIIAVLTKYCNSEPVVIIGQDKDYKQLFFNKNNLIQYCPIKEVVIEHDRNTIAYDLFSHICRGESSDGICSIINPPDCFVKGIRQKPLKETYITEAYEFALKGELETFFSTEVFKRFNENKKLVDLRCIPLELVENIIYEYNNYKMGTTNVYKYLVEKNLTGEFLRDISKF